jgi:hypothetical protein
LHADKPGICRQNAAHAEGILCGQGGEHGAAMHAEDMKGAQVGLNSGVAAAVAAGDGQRHDTAHRAVIGFIFGHFVSTKKKSGRSRSAQKRLSPPIPSRRHDPDQVQRVFSQPPDARHPDGNW